MLNDPESFVPKPTQIQDTIKYLMVGILFVLSSLHSVCSPAWLISSVSCLIMSIVVIYYFMTRVHDWSIIDYFMFLGAIGIFVYVGLPLALVGWFTLI